MTTYHRIIRKMVVGFGDLFNDIDLVRYDANGVEQQRQKVPLAYSSKERYVMRLQGDPELDRKVQITLPRMSFELNGLSYDASRKQITNIKNFAPSNNADTILSQYNPVPYDFDFSLYIYVRNIEDGTQIIERILPYFTPDYTIKLNLIPEMGIIKDVPVILKNTNYDVTYEGPSDQETRTIIWTLNFTVKGFIYGPTSEPKIIKRSITNIYDSTFSSENVFEFNMAPGGLGDYQEGEYVYQGYSLDNSTASARVIVWNNNTLRLKVDDMTGNFVSNKPIYGVRTGAKYTMYAAQVKPERLFRVDVTPVPPSAGATANSNFMFNITITEGNTAIVNVNSIIPSSYVYDFNSNSSYTFVVTDDLNIANTTNKLDTAINTTINPIDAN